MNPQDNPTLKAELEQILEANKLDRIMFDEALAAVLATISKHLPEKKKEKLYAGEPYSLVGKEWNDAITEMEQKLGWKS